RQPCRAASARAASMSLPSPSSGRPPAVAAPPGLRFDLRCAIAASRAPPRPCEDQTMEDTGGRADAPAGAAEASIGELARALGGGADGAAKQRLEPASTHQDVEGRARRAARAGDIFAQ